MPAYDGPLHAWRCAKCRRVWHMRPGVLPPPTGCGNSFAGCAGREAPVERAPELDQPALVLRRTEGSIRRLWRGDRG